MSLTELTTEENLNEDSDDEPRMGVFLHRNLRKMKAIRKTKEAAANIKVQNGL